MKRKTYYKLTDKDGYTRKGKTGETLWGENITHTATGQDKELCTDGFIHAYESPEMAAFMNPAHGDYDSNTMLLWECHLHGRVKRDGQLKCGAKGCTTLRTIPLPIITTEQRITIAIKISLLFCKDDGYIKWATKWLSGVDRTAAWAEEVVAGAAADAAADAANAADIDILVIIKEVINSK